MKPIDLKKELLETERQLIITALKGADYNVKAAAKLLTISVSTLRRKIEENKIAVPKNNYANWNAAPQKPMVITPWYAMKMKRILEELELADGCRTDAARTLGISLRSLRMWIKDAANRGEHVTPAKYSRRQKDDNGIGF